MLLETIKTDLDRMNIFLLLSETAVFSLFVLAEQWKVLNSKSERVVGAVNCITGENKRRKGPSGVG